MSPQHQLNRIRTPFGRLDRRRVIDAIDLSGQRAIVTGGSSGIGTETARASPVLAAILSPIALPARRRRACRLRIRVSGDGQPLTGVTIVILTRPADSSLLDVCRYRNMIAPWHEQRRRRTSSTRSPSSKRREILVLLRAGAAGDRVGPGAG